eukprot:12910197-Prorocentrum_lima.AAC.1
MEIFQHLINSCCKQQWPQRVPLRYPARGGEPHNVPLGCRAEDVGRPLAKGQRHRVGLREELRDTRQADRS